MITLSFFHKDFIFVTDQLAQDVRAYRNSTREYVGRFVLDRSTPYDIMMYADSRQEEMDTGIYYLGYSDYVFVLVVRD